MRPLDQTVLGSPGGNCFGACVASILELPIDLMPNPHEPNWVDLWNNWLRPYNLRLLIIEHKQWLEKPEGYSILGGRSPRGDWLHAVVCYNGEIVHDPHPDRTGVGEWLDWTVFVVLDPTKPVTCYGDG